MLLVHYRHGARDELGNRDNESAERKGTQRWLVLTGSFCMCGPVCDAVGGAPQCPCLDSGNHSKYAQPLYTHYLASDCKFNTPS